MALNVDNSAIAELYEDVRDDKTETNWAFFDFADGRPDRLKVSGSGTGGLEEFKGHLKFDVAGWGYVRLNFSNDEYSLRVKFILVNWCGESVGVMRKAKLGVQISSVKSVIRSFHGEVPANTLADLNEKEIMTELRRNAGANYDRQNSNY
ncbi:unnamed protein product [Cunninghamella blakesleeana]